MSSLPNASRTARAGLVADFLTERRPAAKFGRSAIVDDHTHFLVVPNPHKRLSKLRTFSSEIYSASIVLLMGTA